jgi:TetR/AcrR family transcriptional regulator, regulator of autoinduction and epiphytic fitness
LIECYSREVSEEVKARFPRRQERARATRLAVLDAARELFVGNGYGATTIQAIADEAGVAVQTVYAVFGNKRAILSELLDVSIAGDDKQVVVNAREWMQAVWNAPTAAERLGAYAAAVARIMQSAGDVFAVVTAAAATDTEVIELANTTEARRRQGAAAVVDSVRSVSALRPGLTPDRAVDVLWLLNGPLVYTQLVRQAAWPLDRYQAWLADTMVQQLLGDDR